jgi:hypothetical protein
VTPVNDAPIANDDTVALVTEDGAVINGKYFN